MELVFLIETAAAAGVTAIANDIYARIKTLVSLPFTKKNKVPVILDEGKYERLLLQKPTEVYADQSGPIVQNDGPVGQQNNGNDNNNTYNNYYHQEHERSRKRPTEVYADQSGPIVQNDGPVGQQNNGNRNNNTYNNYPQERRRSI